MAIGLANMFNIKFPINFDSPYRATCIIDFWRRWHITLSNFSRTYLYIPLGGNRGSSFNRYRNLFITMLLGGLWHGANWTFIVWGSLHGLYLIVNHIWRNICFRKIEYLEKSKIYNGFSWFLTSTCVMGTWVIFRADNMMTASSILKSMVGFNGFSVSPLLQKFISNPKWINYAGFFKNKLFNFTDYISVVIGGMLIIFIAPNVKYFFANYLNLGYTKNPSLISSFSTVSFSFLRWKPNLLCAFILALITAWIIITLLSSQTIEFLYFEF